MALFSRDGRQLYLVAEDSLFSYPVMPAAGGIRLGERSLLFPFHHPFRGDSTIGAITRDGQRILAIATESDEAVQSQVLSDWTSLLARAEDRK